MTARPIIYSAPMVLAQLEGRKTQTRRLAWRDAKFGLQDYSSEQLEDFELRGWYAEGEGNDGKFRVYKPTPWQRVRPGDLLWVKEGWRDEHPVAIQEGRYSQPGQAGIPGPPGVSYRTIYRADGDPLQAWRQQDHPYFTLDGPEDEHAAKFASVCSTFDRDGTSVYWESSIHMPRWASRITDEVTAVRIERLQDISEADAFAEGVTGEILDEDTGERKPFGPCAVMNYGALWSKLHGADSWNANPFVVVITFRVHKCNIDRLPAAERGAA